MSLPAWRRN